MAISIVRGDLCAIERGPIDPVKVSSLRSTLSPLVHNTRHFAGAAPFQFLSLLTTRTYDLEQK
jgi:hypothetical protein